MASTNEERQIKTRSEGCEPSMIAPQSDGDFGAQVHPITDLKHILY
jgi:hypothetical protein